MNVDGEAAKKTMFEEMFHAGQDEFNTKNGFNQSNIEKETEVEFAAVVAGIGNDGYKIAKNCPNIIKMLKEGKPVDAKTIEKDWNGVIKAVKNIKGDYPQFGGEFNGDKFVKYLNSLIKEINKK